MADITTVGLDLAKNVFQLHGADRSDKRVLPTSGGAINFSRLYRRSHLVL